MQATTPHTTEYYKGQDSSISPTALESGVFSLCSGGVPKNGGFQRIPGKSIENLGLNTGGVITLYQFGSMVVAQTFMGLLIFSIDELLPKQEDYVIDNAGNLVTTKSGIQIINPK